MSIYTAFLMGSGEKGYRVVSRDTGKEHWPGFSFSFLHSSSLRESFLSVIYFYSCHVWSELRIGWTGDGLLLYVGG